MAEGTEVGENRVPEPGYGSLTYELVAEFFGTFILLFIGNGAVTASVAISGASFTPLQVGIVYGVAVSLAIFACGAISGAHIGVRPRYERKPATRPICPAKAPFFLSEVIPYGCHLSLVSSNSKREDFSELLLILCGMVRINVF